MAELAPTIWPPGNRTGNELLLVSNFRLIIVICTENLKSILETVCHFFFICNGSIIHWSGEILTFFCVISHKIHNHNIFL